VCPLAFICRLGGELSVNLGHTGIRLVYTSCELVSINHAFRETIDEAFLSTPQFLPLLLECGRTFP
jgi:hypothetical protein